MSKSALFLGLRASLLSSFLLLSPNVINFSVRVNNPLPAQILMNTNVVPYMS